jgi:hypothetical protein
VLEALSSADESGGNQDQTGPRSGTSVDNEAKPDMEKGLEKVAAKQNKAQAEGIEIKVEAMAIFQQ